jgi:hypothetical protein
MANTLTAIVNSIWAKMIDAPKEVRGALDAVSMDIDNTPVDIGQPFKVSVAGAATAAAWSPRMYETAQGDQTPTAITMNLAATEAVFNLSDAERGNLQRTGDNAYESFFQQSIAQAHRANSAVTGAALLGVIKAGASRAVGTAGTTPFASDTSALEQALYELKRNGAPKSDLVAVLSSAAWLNFRLLGIVQQASLNGGDARKTGLLGKESGFELFEDFGIGAHVIGTASGTKFTATTDAGATSLSYDGDTNGPWTAGDVVTFGSGGGSGTADANKYIVSAANTATPLVINSPGLLIAHADEDTMTVGASYTPSHAFSRSAIKSVIRPVTCNVGGQVVGVSPIVDQYGLPSTLIEIRGTGMSVFSVVQAYGFAAIKPYAIMTILG